MKIFIAWALSIAPVGVIAQAAGGGITDLNWTTIIVSYGIATPLVLYVIVDNRRKDQRITDVEKRNQTLTDTAIDKIVPLQSQTIDVLRDARQELKDAALERERAMTMIHQMQGRVDPLILTRIHHQLARLEEMETK